MAISDLLGHRNVATVSETRTYTYQYASDMLVAKVSTRCSGEGLRAGNRSIRPPLLLFLRCLAFGSEIL